MKTRLLLIIGIITLPLFVSQGFSQCIYNDDWPDAPCFDMGPVSHQKFYDAWAPYYEYKGEDWMGAKKVEMNQALENQSFEEWAEKLENYNVYRYYLSRNEVQSSLPYDSHSVILDPNFTPRTSIPDEKICGFDAMLIDGVCQITTVESTHYVNTSPFYQALLMFGLFLWPFFLSGSAIFIVLTKTPRFKKSTRIAVTIPALLIIVWFLAMFFVGIWPRAGA